MLMALLLQLHCAPGGRFQRALRSELQLESELTLMLTRRQQGGR